MSQDRQTTDQKTSQAIRRVKVTSTILFGVVLTTVTILIVGIILVAVAVSMPQ